jgi:hypothetical protein
MIVDSLFGGAGATLDPNSLLTPAPGERARATSRDRYRAPVPGGCGA